MGESLTGPFGYAEHLDIPDVPSAAQTVDHWLITAPRYHPLWSQYVLCCVRLDDVEGFPPPILKFEGATHELLVVALSPDAGHLTRERMAAFAVAGGGLPVLEPVNIADQFIATDEEMRRVCELAAKAVINGALCPETADGPDRVRRAWLGAVVKTLAHMRGEDHAP